MNDKKSRNDLRLDTKEFELPETLFSRDIDDKVFQGIILHTLAAIEGISLVGGNFIDNILGRSGPEGIIGIAAEQDGKNSSINIKIELNVCYGVCIPQKAEEIQIKIAEEVTRLTGLHVATVHTVFKNVISPEQMNKATSPTSTSPSSKLERDIEEEYNDEF